MDTQQERQLTPQQQELAQQIETAQNDPAYRENQHTSGYMDSTYKWQPAEAPEEPVEQEAPMETPELDALAQKLGIDPNQLGRSQEEIDADKPPMPTEDWYKQQFGTEEAKQFADNFKKHLGIDIKEVYDLIHNTANVTTGLERWRQQVQNERDLGILQQEFGQEFQSIMPQVKAEFDRIAQVNPQQAAALDNIDGVRYLAAYIRQRNGSVTQPRSMNVPNVPDFQLPNVRRRSGTGGTNAPIIRMSEFITWSDDEVQARMRDIMLAKQNGTFLNDL